MRSASAGPQWRETMSIARILPGRRAARGDDASAVVRKNEVRLGSKANLRKTPTEEIRIAPVTCCGLAFEQTGGRQKDRAGARGIDGASGPMLLAKPLLQLGVAVAQIVIGSKQKLGNNDDFGILIVVNGRLRCDRSAVRALKLIPGQRDDLGSLLAFRRDLRRRAAATACRSRRRRRPTHRSRILRSRAMRG